jgi:putative effector of murein hydrolase
VSIDEKPADRSSAGTERTLRIVFGWIVGVVAGAIANYGVAGLFGEHYPIVPTTFVAIVACAFAGMAIAERLGPRSTPWVAIVTAITLVVAAVLFVGPWLSMR